MSNAAGEQRRLAKPRLPVHAGEPVDRGLRECRSERLLRDAQRRADGVGQQVRVDADRADRQRGEGHVSNAGDRADLDGGALRGESLPEPSLDGLRISVGGLHQRNGGGAERAAGRREARLQSVLVV